MSPDWHTVGTQQILADNDVTGGKGETLTLVMGLIAYAGWNGVCAASAVLAGLLTG